MGQVKKLAMSLTHDDMKRKAMDVVIPPQPKPVDTLEDLLRQQFYYQMQLGKEGDESRLHN